MEIPRVVWKGDNRILKPQDIARKVLEILQDPNKFENPVIEMPSFEF